MKTLRLNYPAVILMMLMSMTGLYSNANGQFVQVEATASESSLKADQEVQITLYIVDPADAYFFSAEIEYDSEVLTYERFESVGLMQDGLEIADQIQPGVIGAAVSRTSALQDPSDGNLMTITFSVNTFSSTEESSIEFDKLTFSDSNGDPIPFLEPDEVTFTIEESISAFSLHTPLSVTVTEGESFTAAGQIFANGVTADEGNAPRIQMWVGVNHVNTNPSGWHETMWELMDYDNQTSNDFFEYLGELTFQRDVGTYYVALRAELDGSGEYAYAGVGGFWDENEAISTMLEINQQEQYQYVVAEWTFSDELYTPDRSTFPNRWTELELIGASLSGFTAGAANSNGWSSYGEQENYWKIVLNTEGLGNLKLSSDHSGGSNTGPRDFKVEYSTDGTAWEDLPGGVIKVGDSEMQIIDQLPLPETVEDQPEVYIRWIQNSDERVDGNSELSISGGGTNRIDDILITGQAITPARVDVWPGDTDGNGTVDENDVLTLATYWLTEGPQAIYPGITWGAREVEEWIPAEATAADTDGSGRVDQNDLQAIGLNFGKTTQEGQSVQRQLPAIAELRMDPLELGETVELFLVADTTVELSGLSFRLDMNGLESGDWKIKEIKPLDWATDWQESNRLIEFKTNHTDFWAAAMAHKGRVVPNITTNLARVTLEATREWEEPATLRLLKASALAHGETKKLTGITITENLAVSIEPPVTERPERTELLPNYPNPFNPVTTIPYTLSSPGDIRVEVFDAIGRRVAQFYHEAQRPGHHTIEFDASSLSSGLYLYRLQTNEIVQTRKMTLLK